MQLKCTVLSIAICIMATSSAWLSILVKRGQDIVKPRTVMKCSWEEMFGALLDKLDLPETTIEKVHISANEKFIDPVHVVPIDAPVCLCDPFKCMHQITEQFQHALFVDPSLLPSDLTAKSLKKAEAYQKFIKSHCHSSQYIFQIKKCSDATCFYWLEHPVCLPSEIFESLSFLPLPLMVARRNLVHFMGKHHQTKTDRHGFVRSQKQ